MYHFNSKKVTAVLNGIPLSGYTDGEFLSVSFNGSLWTPKTGIDGEVTRIKNKNLSGTATISLNANSISNTILSAALIEVDYNTGYGVAFFSIVDTNDGAEILTASESFLTQPPIFGYSTEVGERIWTLHLNKITTVIGRI